MLQKTVEKCKELVSAVEQPTMEMKVSMALPWISVQNTSYYHQINEAEEEKRLAKERALQKLLEMTEKIKSELQELILTSKWVLYTL